MREMTPATYNTGMLTVLIVRWLLTGLVVLGSTSSVAHAVESGHSAIWYDPDRSGEGWVLEILEENRAVAYWYTYDDEGNQRWLVGAGQVFEDEDGTHVNLPELFVASGGQFGAQFDPDDVVLELVGKAAFRFKNCNEGLVDFEAFGTTGQTPLTRLTRTMGAGCSTRNGIPGQPVEPYAGESGSWFDLTHSGEGFTLHWLANGLAVVYWFTYDEEGNQVWLFGVGEERGGEIIFFDDLLRPQGARFGEAFDPADVELVPWGQMSMALGCDDGTMSYASTFPEFGFGGQNLSRLTQLLKPQCPYEKPVFTDLYDVTWTEIPIESDAGDGFTNPEAQSIADDGTIVGFVWVPGGTRGVMWRPELGEWVLMGELVIASGAPIRISPDATTVIANEQIVAGDVPYLPATWQDTAGWEVLPDTIFFKQLLNGVSESHTAVVGTGSERSVPGAIPGFGPQIREHVS